MIFFSLLLVFVTLQVKHDLFHAVVRILIHLVTAPVLILYGLIKHMLKCDLLALQWLFNLMLILK